MAINRISAPGASPSSIADWSAVVAQLAALVLDKEAPRRISGSNVLKGSFFNIGGVLYVADADTAISGTASDYVKITPAGATASASFLANLTGVTWNSTYKGFYDASGNLVISELLAPRGQKLFSASGSFLVPPGVTKIYCTGIGGGGDGGAGAIGDSINSGGGGGGGGGGAFGHKVPITVVPGTSYAVTIGAKTATSFGALLALPPGGNGGNASSSTAGAAGAAGAGTEPTLSGLPGAIGVVGGLKGAGAGLGGPGSGGGLFRIGTGGASGTNGAAGGAGVSPGSGGGGGGGNTSGSSAGAGGAGKPGFLLIEW